MANDPLIWASLLVALAAILLMINLGRRSKGQTAAAAPADSPAHEAHLLKFVVDESGQRKGETVAVDGDALIVKTAEGFARVPAEKVSPEGDGLKLTGAVDWDSARREGDAWRERSHKVITYEEEELPKDEP